MFTRRSFIESLSTLPLVGGFIGGAAPSAADRPPRRPLPATTSRSSASGPSSTRPAPTPT